MLCLNVGLWLQWYVQYVCMFLTRCHEFMFPATKGHFRSEPEVAARGRYYCTTANKSHSSLRYATTYDSRSTALRVIGREFRSSPEFQLANSHSSVFSHTTGIGVYF